jgi:hypothetical protein
MKTGKEVSKKLRLAQMRDSLWHQAIALAHLWFYAGGRAPIEFFAYPGTFGTDNEDLKGKRIKITIEIEAA